jgi:hypothetical protein
MAQLMGRLALLPFHFQLARLPVFLGAGWRMGYVLHLMRTSGCTLFLHFLTYTTFECEQFHSTGVGCASDTLSERS